LKREERGYDDIPEGLLENATAGSELEICKCKFSDIMKNSSNVEAKVTKTRLLHVRERLERLIDGAQSSTTELEVKVLLNSLQEFSNSFDLAQRKKIGVSESFIRDEIPAQLPPPISPCVLDQPERNKERIHSTNNYKDQMSDSDAQETQDAENNHAHAQTPQTNQNFQNLQSDPNAQNAMQSALV
jgi:hypothetical protein